MRLSNAKAAALGIGHHVPKRGRRARGAPPEFPPIAHGHPVCAFDVSSTAAGMALVVNELRGLRVITTDLCAPPKAWHATRRSDDIAREVARFAAMHATHLVVFEWSGNRGGDSARPYLRQMVGAQYAARQAVLDTGWPADSVEEVLDSFWTARESKDHRARRIARTFPAYDPSGDPGSDVADAIALAVWRLTR